MQQLWSLLQAEEEYEVAGRQLVEVMPIPSERASSSSAPVIVEVRDILSGEVFALKKVPCPTRQRRNAALYEARLLESLAPHKNVVRCFGFALRNSSEATTGAKHSEVLILLEMLPGGDLLKYLRRNRGLLSETKLLRAFTDVVEGVFWLHSQGPALRHLGLTMENIVRGRDRSWKIVGFGCCSVEVPAQELLDERDDREAPQARTDVAEAPSDKYLAWIADIAKSEIKGSERSPQALVAAVRRCSGAQYLPPELLSLSEDEHRQADQSPVAAITLAADLWMLGCILFCLIFNRLPFRERELHAIRNAHFLLPSRKSAPSPRLVDLLVWLLSPCPEERPSARTLAETLWRWSGGDAFEGVELPASVVERRNRILARAVATAGYARVVTVAETSANLKEADAPEAPEASNLGGHEAEDEEDVDEEASPAALRARIASLEAELRRARVVARADEVDEPSPAAPGVDPPQSMASESFARSFAKPVSKRGGVDPPQSGLSIAKPSAASAAPSQPSPAKPASGPKRVGSSSVAAPSSLSLPKQPTPPTMVKDEVSSTLSAEQQVEAAAAAEATIRAAALAAMTSVEGHPSTHDASSSTLLEEEGGVLPLEALLPALRAALAALAELERSASELSERCGIVARRVQWQAMGDQIATSAGTFARAANCLFDATKRLRPVVTYLGRATERLPEGAQALLEEIDSRQMAAMDKLQALRTAETLSLSGPSFEMCQVDARFLHAWLARLRWEAAFLSFESAASCFSEALSKAEDDEVPLASGPAGKGKGRCPLPPPMASGKGKGTKKGGTLVEDQQERSPTSAKAELREEKPLFGRLTRTPDKAMFGNLIRDFPTFVDKLRKEKEHVASIDRAFGGRGRLLIHACVCDGAPATKATDVTAVRSLTHELASRFVQVIKGSHGPVGDRRRISLELRFKKMAPRVVEDLAQIVNRFDFEGFDCMAAAGHLDPSTFWPQVSISSCPREDAVETEKILSAFLLPEEQQALSALEKAGQTEPLHGLEKRLLPFVHVQCFPVKAKLFHIRLAYPAIENDVIEGYRLATRACDSVRTSSCLLDLLSVTLQIATYVANFGRIDIGDQGFSLLKLQYYEDFRIGQCHTFLSVLCAFLMNLRPKGVAAAVAAGVDETTQRNGEKARRAASGVSFVDLLDKELAEARVVFDRGLSQAELRKQGSALQEMAKYVRRQIANECALFEPPTLDGDAAARFVELAAWAHGHNQLSELLETLQGSVGAVEEAEAAFQTSAIALQEFAALRESDVGRTDYLEVLDAILQFVDRLKRCDQELRVHPDEHLELRRRLLMAAPLQIVFSKLCLGEAFDLWFRKASGPESKGQEWTPAIKEASIRSLFQLFDTDADDSVDAEELRVTLQALGVDLPTVEDHKVHHGIIRFFDENRNGALELGEFRRFVEERIKVVFELFRGTPGKEGSISEADLQRVATTLGREDVTDEIIRKMIRWLDEAADDSVNAREFERLILMPEMKPKRLDTYNRYNRPVSPGNKIRRNASSFRVWVTRGDPGDGGSDTSSND